MVDPNVAGLGGDRCACLVCVVCRSSSTFTPPPDGSAPTVYIVRNSLMDSRSMMSCVSVIHRKLALSRKLHRLNYSTLGKMPVLSVRKHRSCTADATHRAVDTGRTIAWLVGSGSLRALSPAESRSLVWAAAGLGDRRVLFMGRGMVRCRCPPRVGAAVSAGQVAGEFANAPVRERRPELARAAVSTMTARSASMMRRGEPSAQGRSRRAAPAALKTWITSCTVSSPALPDE